MINMTWRKIFKMQWAMKLRFALDKSRKIPDSEMCICGGDSPFDLELQSVWGVRGVKTGFNLGAHAIWSDSVVITELVPKWNPFHKLCDDLHIASDIPYRLGALKLTIVKGVKLNQTYLLIKGDTQMGFTPKWCTLQPSQVPQKLWMSSENASFWSKSTACNGVTAIWR